MGAAARQSKGRILIVDDEPHNCGLLSELVVREECEPVVASGGAEALEMLAGTAVDLVLLDLRMPGMDGMSVLAELGRRGALPALPVVVVTAKDERQVRIDALAAGAIDFLVKPIDRLELACKMRTLLELRRLRETARADAATARSLLQAVLDSAPDLVVYLDRAGTIQFISGVGNKRLPQYRPEQVVGSSWLSYVPADHHTVLQDLLRNVLATGQPTDYEASTDGTDGSAVWFSSHIGPVLLGQEIVGAVVIARDVTEKKQLDAQLIAADRMASVGILASGVAHEINNPLAVVLANLRMALREGLPPELVDGLRDAHDGAERIREIVSDLRIFSRPDDQRHGPVDTEQVLESTLRLVATEIRHRARLVKRHGKVPPVVANESSLGQVFLNLLTNAAHAIPEGHAEANEIRVSTLVERNGQVAVEITDTGAGMSAEVQQRLFTPFFTTKPPGVGTGLGLAICRRIVTDLGGRIEVESEVGKGTTFRVILPPAKTEEVTVATTPERLAATPAPRRGRILVIDDESMLLASIRRNLSAEHEVVTATAARLALERFRAGERFDVILCDLMMPDMTGMDFHAELERVAPDEVERTIFMTGGAFTPAARAFLDRVPNRIFEKPFDPLELRALINDRIRQDPAPRRSPP